MLSLPVVVALDAIPPNAMLPVPVLKAVNAWNPTAVLLPAVESFNA
jgi:hypothetical protein